MLPMIASAEAVGANWKLVYGGRNRDSMAFLDELAGYGDRVTVHPQDEVGHHRPLATFLAEPRDDVQIYSCGPGAAARCSSSRRQRIGRRAACTPNASPRRTCRRPRGALDSFEVVCQRSGVTLKIGAGQSILDAADEAGIKVLSSCRALACAAPATSTCSTAQPDHRDSVLSAAERRPTSSCWSAYHARCPPGSSSTCDRTPL